MSDSRWILIKSAGYGFSGSLLSIFTKLSIDLLAGFARFCIMIGKKACSIIMCLVKCFKIIVNVCACVCVLACVVENFRKIECQPSPDNE